MKNDPAVIAGMLVACLLAMLMVGAMGGAKRVSTNPQAVPSAAREVVPCCPTRAFGQPQSYYPCMYSSREFSA